MEEAGLIGSPPFWLFFIITVTNVTKLPKGKEFCFSSWFQRVPLALLSCRAPQPWGHVVEELHYTVYRREQGQDTH